MAACVLEVAAAARDRSVGGGAPGGRARRPRGRGGGAAGQTRALRGLQPGCRWRRCCRRGDLGRPASWQTSSAAMQDRRARAIGQRRLASAPGCDLACHRRALPGVPRGRAGLLLAPSTIHGRLGRRGHFCGDGLPSGAAAHAAAEAPRRGAIADEAEDLPPAAAPAARMKRRGTPPSGGSFQWPLGPTLRRRRGRRPRPSALERAAPRRARRRRSAAAPRELAHLEG